MSWLSKKLSCIEVDIHSHLIPGIDDGSLSIEDSLEMLVAFQNQGFKKLITTPHIHPRYPNTHLEILEGLRSLQKALVNNNLNIELEAAAEYFVDESFLEKLKNQKELLCFGDKYILVECSFITKPMILESAIFDLRAQGYKPIFAHPERYMFLEGDIDWLVELKQSGVLFQVTLGSFSGYYGEMAKKIAKKLLKKEMIDFLASDLHRISQFKHLKKALELKEVQKLIRSNVLLNHTLL